MTSTDNVRPKISIISPFFLVEDCLERFLFMVRLQTLEDIEIVLVDDCGTDASRKIAEAHAAQDPRIRIIENEQHIGLGASRNVGISQARGEYLAFPDTNDWVDADFYEGLFRSAVQNDFPDIVKGTCTLMENQNASSTVDNRINAFIRDGLAAGKPLYTLFTAQHCTAIYHRSLFEKHGVRHGTTQSPEDNVFLLRACHAASSFAISDSPVQYHYSHRPNTISTTYNEARMRSDAVVFSEQIDYLLEQIEPSTARQSYVISQTSAYLDNSSGITEPGFAYRRAHPYWLAKQLRRLPDINEIAAQSPLARQVLCDTPRAFNPPAQPFFSIVIPVRNMASTIARALESILVQSFESYEIIVVPNDCSDDTVAIVKQQAALFPQIRVIELACAGSSRARNAGIEAAHGRYLLFLDADDFYLSGALEQIAHTLEQHPCDILFTNRGKETVINVDASVYEINPAVMRALIDAKPSAALPENFATYQGWPMLYSQCGNAYRCAFIRDNHLRCNSRLVAYEDRLFNSHACAKAESVCVLAGQCYYYAYEEHLNPPSGIEFLQTAAENIKLFLEDWGDLGLESKQAALSYTAGVLRMMDITVNRCDDMYCTKWYREYLQSHDAQTVLQAVKTGLVSNYYRLEYEKHRPILAEELARIESPARACAD